MIPERWLVLRVRAPSDELVTELAEGLVALGGSAVEEDMGLLTTYVAAPANPEAYVRAANDRLQAIVPGAALELSWHWRMNEDWERKWRRGLRPRRVGERLVVTPSWIEPQGRPGDIMLVIDPKMAFGTGEHATTRAMLRLLESAIRPGDRVLDVGTGTGILAVAAVRLGAVEALGVDNDVMALENAAENVERNSAAGQVRLEHARVDAAFLERFSPGRPGRLDLILANVSSTVLMPLLGPFHDALGRGGRLVLGGMLEAEAEAMMASAGRARLELRAVAQEAGWWSGLFQRGDATAKANTGVDRVRA